MGKNGIGAGGMVQGNDQSLNFPRKHGKLGAKVYLRSWLHSWAANVLGNASRRHIPDAARGSADFRCTRHHHQTLSDLVVCQRQGRQTLCTFNSNLLDAIAIFLASWFDDSPVAGDPSVSMATGTWENAPWENHPPIGHSP